MNTLIYFTRKITILLIVLSLGVIGSCREQPEKKETTSETSTSSTPDATESNASDSKEEVALNPAHGQLNHRCDIPVGAPLSSAPAKSSNTSNSGVPTNNSGDVKLNPAHGQPGHRCDIKVGDPL